MENKTIQNGYNFKGKILSLWNFQTFPQNSSKKLKDSANFGVIYSKNQRKWPKNKGETTKIPKWMTKHSKYYRMGTILKQKYWAFEIFKQSLKTQGEKTQ